MQNRHYNDFPICVSYEKNNTSIKCKTHVMHLIADASQCGMHLTAADTSHENNKEFFNNFFTLLDLPRNFPRSLFSLCGKTLDYRYKR